MSEVVIPAKIADRLTDDVLHKWGFPPLGATSDGQLVLSLEADASATLLSNMLANECPELCKELLGFVPQDNGLRPAGGDGPRLLRQLLSM